ncbi:hypothetical protein HYQ46_006962 [Verticillium longisporum]|nr:hypothetical protein HYQ46_006962 [Verticillium longisporum]
MFGRGLSRPQYAEAKANEANNAQREAARISVDALDGACARRAVFVHGPVADHALALRNGLLEDESDILLRKGRRRGLPVPPPCRSLG